MAQAVQKIILSSSRDIPFNKLVLRALSDWGMGCQAVLLRVGNVPAGHSLLFAVGVEPPHDGVSRARHLNL